MATNNQPLHLHHLQLFAIGSVGQFALQKLLEHFATTEQPNAANEKEALSQIFTKEKDKVKNFRNIFINPIVTKAVYQDVNKNVFQPEIEINMLDTNTCAEILRGIKDFPTGNHSPSWTCKGRPIHLSKCCQKCKHLCPNCKKEECKGNKCCITKKKCSHPCNNCPISTNDCKENKYQCCTTCPCLGCCLKAQCVVSWHDFYNMLVFQSVSNICPKLVLRLSISIISIFRNIAMHLTVPTCVNMDNRTFSDPNAPSYCISWKLIKDTIWFAVKTLLTYLKDCGYITELQYKEHSEALLCMCEASSHQEITIYNKRILNFAEMENYSHYTDLLATMHLKMDAIGDTVDKIHQAIRRISIKCKIVFPEALDTNRCSIYCKEAEKVETICQNSANVIFGTTDVTLYTTLFEPENPKNEPSTRAVQIMFTIEIPGYASTEYQNPRSGKSKALWMEIRKSLFNELPDDAIVNGPTGWMPGSVLIQVFISKADCSEWSKTEIIHIDSLLATFEKTVEEFKPSTSCSCERVKQQTRSTTEIEELKSHTVVQVCFNLHINSNSKFDRELMINSIDENFMLNDIKIEGRITVDEMVSRDGEQNIAKEPLILQEQKKKSYLRELLNYKQIDTPESRIGSHSKPSESPTPSIKSFSTDITDESGYSSLRSTFPRATMQYQQNPDVIKAIRDRKVQDGKTLYQNSWVSESELQHCTEQIRKFNHKDVLDATNDFKILQLKLKKEGKKEKVCSPKQKENDCKTKENRKQDAILRRSQSTTGDIKRHEDILANIKTPDFLKDEKKKKIIDEALITFKSKYCNPPKKDDLKEVKEEFEIILKTLKVSFKQNFLECKNTEYTGSTYEGLKISGDGLEFDVMFLFEGGEDLKVLPIPDEDGFAHLALIDKDIAKDNAITKSASDGIILSQKLKNKFKGVLQNFINNYPQYKDLVTMKEHGPAIQFDVKRNKGDKDLWYSVDLLPSFEVSVGNEKHIYVPKRIGGNLNSWRRSFSKEEKSLLGDIDSGNKNRREVARTLKAIVKKELKNVPSYAIKTTLLHVCFGQSKIDEESWKPQEYTNRVFDMLALLEGYFKEKWLPNFFLPSQNLLRSFNDKNLENIENRLKGFRSSEKKFLNIIKADGDLV